MKQIKGFSLIELLTVITIISLLSAAAVPSYRNYVIRSKIAALMPIAENVKTDVINKRGLGVIFGTNTTAVYSAADASKPDNLYSLEIGNYGCVNLRIDLTTVGLSNSNAQELTMQWCPSESNGIIQWSQGHTSSSETSFIEYLPIDFQQVSTPDTSW